MMRRLATPFLLLLAAACASNPDDGAPSTTPAPSAADPRMAVMQTQMTELLERIDVLNDRIARLEESQMAAAEPVEAPRSVDAPRSAAAPSRATTSATATSERPTPAPTQKALAGARIAEDYRKAIMLFSNGRHADARRGFEAVFESDPNGELADNALFWIGETWFAVGNFTNAVRSYTRVVNEFADQNKAPDALFKTGVAQARTGDLALARRTFQQVIERYPYATASTSAKAELKRIRF